MSWRSMIERQVSLSTVEVEYLVLTKVVKEAVWLKGLAGDLGIQQLSIKTVRVLYSWLIIRASLDDQTYCPEVPFNQRLWLKSLLSLEKIRTLEIQYIC